MLSFSYNSQNNLNYASTLNVREVMKFYNLGDYAKFRNRLQMLTPTQSRLYIEGKL